jgi:hypothetical protein
MGCGAHQPNEIALAALVEHVQRSIRMPGSTESHAPAAVRLTLGCGQLYNAHTLAPRLPLSAVSKGLVWITIALTYG